MRRLAAIALALAGCATAAPPPPVRVEPREVSALRVQLARMPGVSAPADAYEVSEVFVNGRVVVLYWQAEVRGEGWRQTERALCRRCGDDVGWFCARMTPDVLAELPRGATAEIRDLSVEDAVKAVAFVREREPSRKIVRLTALDDRRTCVRFDSDPPWVVVERDGALEIESAVAPSAWFSGPETSMECGEYVFYTYPSVTGCAE
jgi:hypothetical protein